MVRPVRFEPSFRRRSVNVCVPTKSPTTTHHPLLLRTTMDDDNFSVSSMYRKEKQKKLVGSTSCQGLAYLVFPVLLIAISAVDWLAFGWLERNFTFFATISASSLVHFSRAAETTSLKTHSPSHSLVQLVIHWILLGSTIPLYTAARVVHTRN